MFDGNAFDVTVSTQKRQHSRLSFEEMGNELLDAMQGTLLCLDAHHIIVDVSKTVKQYFGFEQAEIIGLSVLLLVEDSERDSFLKFLNHAAQSSDMYCVRMMMNSINEYRQVKILRKRKHNQDTADVHSTTPRHSGSTETILVVTLEDSSYIDITLYDIHKQEFYTKMNLVGEITFEDHRGALITGYLPQELLSQSIFNFVYHEDRLVKLHALWKCVTTGSSKLQWRLNARDGSLVFLQTEYKLVSDEKNRDTITARNEVLSPVQISQFDELQTAWKHQCAADIKGNSSSFKILSSVDNDSKSASNGECRICVPSLNMCFVTNKLQPLNLQGNVFEASRLARPLSIQDYVRILIDNDKHMDNELAVMVNNIQSLTARYRRSNEPDKLHDDSADKAIDEKPQAQAQLKSPLPSPLTDSALRRKHDADSIVRGILNNSIKYNHENQSGDPTATTISRLLNGSGNNAPNGAVRSPSAAAAQPRLNQSKSVPTSLESLQQQHMDFLRKYKSAKSKLESQLELFRHPDGMSASHANDVARRNIILHKLAQLEHIKGRHLARRHDGKRQLAASAVPGNSTAQKDLLQSLFSPPPGSNGQSSADHTSSSNPSPLSALFAAVSDSSPTFSSTYQSQRSSSEQFNSDLSSACINGDMSLFDDLSLSSSYTPVNPNLSTPTHSFTNSSYPGSRDDSPAAATGTSLNDQHQGAFRY